MRRRPIFSHIAFLAFLLTVSDLLNWHEALFIASQGYKTVTVWHYSTVALTSYSLSRIMAFHFIFFIFLKEHNMSIYSPRDREDDASEGRDGRMDDQIQTPEAIDPARTGKKQADRLADGRFRSGYSGNPRGRPPGRRNRAAELFDEVIDDDEFRRIVRKAASLAGEGNITLLIALLRLRVPPPQPATYPIDLPKLETAGDALTALRIIVDAMARGDIDENHARALTGIVSEFIETSKVVDIDARLRAIESRGSVQ
jgi:hypothetical protein